MYFQLFDVSLQERNKAQLKMISFAISLVALILGYLIYGKFIEYMFGSDTPFILAESMTDGIGSIAMPNWKVFMIQFFNKVLFMTCVVATCFFISRQTSVPDHILFYVLGIVCLLVACIWSFAWYRKTIR